MLGGATSGPLPDAEDAGHDHVERDRLHPRRQRERTTDRPTLELAAGRLPNHLLVALDRIAVERREQQPALAQMARTVGGQHRSRSDDRSQRTHLGRQSNTVSTAGNHSNPPGAP